MFGLGTQELLIVAVLILVLFGGSKIPQLMRSMGQGVGEFKKGVDESKQVLKQSLEDAADDQDKTGQTNSTTTKV